MATLRKPWSASRATALALVSLGAGLGWLALTARHSVLVLSWSDEIVYAVMGRNIASGRGLITNFYDSRALLDGGYPQGDVHMPGHALFMSLFFRLLGSADWVAFAPSWAAFLATGAIAGTLAGRLFGGAAGFLAALLFFVMPGAAGYAHSSMSELTVVLASALFLLAWWNCDTPWRGAAMAVALGVAVLCRETLLAFLILAAESVWRAPRESRRRVALAFLALLAVCVLLLVPLHLGRASFPHVLSDLPPLGTPGWRRAVLGRVRDNLALPVPGTRIEERLFAVQLLLGGLLPILALLVRARGATRRLAGAVLVLMVAVFVELVGLYPLKSWKLVRAFLFLSPWFAVLLAGLLSGRGARVLRSSIACVALWLLGASSLRAVEGLAEDRRTEQARNGEVADLFLRLTKGVSVETLVAQESPWEIGWRRFPVTIVWNVRLEPADLRRVDEVLRIDAVFGRTRPLLALAEAAERGALGTPYELVRRNPSARRQLLLRTDLARPPQGP